MHQKIKITSTNQHFQENYELKILLKKHVEIHLVCKNTNLRKCIEFETTFSNIFNLYSKVGR